LECVELIVSDNGEGIDKSFLPFVFDRFSQADASKTRKHGGLGLGLSIVKDLCELHGGNISVSSEGVGKGTTFKVLLPKADAPEIVSTNNYATLSPDSIASLAGIAILVVDDEKDARGLVREFLEERRAKVMVASSTREALIKILENSFDLIISDISMPVEDGFQLIRKVRNLDDKMKSIIPAIALTAFAKVEDKDLVLKTGFQGYVTKPIEFAQLVAEIHNLRNQV
jgi:CheY-like chemotaxis protein